MRSRLSSFVSVFLLACGGQVTLVEVTPAVDSEIAAVTTEPTSSLEEVSWEAPLDSDRVRVTVPGDRLFAALHGLEGGQTRRVRITWLGDSHTSADYWTGEVRRKLQARFGDGGPGFIPLSLGPRRHEVASFKVKGTWRQEPKSGPSRSRQLDGQFGLSGRRLRGFPGASLDVYSGVKGTSTWSVLHRLEPSQSRDPSLEFRAEARALPHEEERAQGFVVTRFEREATSPVSVHVRRGQYVLFGVVVETEQPGIVVDALGINGARLRTLMAWDSAAWHAQLAWRGADLVVLSYGTNETGDGGDMGRYMEDYRRVTEQIKETGAECLLIGPTDRQGKDRKSLPEVGALDGNIAYWANSFGCLYYSPFVAMGGEGGYARWRSQKPQLASTDGVHLTRAGYRYLADHWVQWFLEQYDAYVSRR